MQVPLTWLKDFVDIKLKLPELMWKMTEAGLTCESYKRVESEVVLDIEVTPNRPDWMSILGIARELAAIENSKLKTPKVSSLPSPKKILLMKFKTDYSLFERWSSVIISGVKIKPSPWWIQKRLHLIGLRPINNIVDITNYVMYELGIPLHAFDYDEIKGGQMFVERAKGKEEFTTVDGISYKLPQNAMVIRDSERIIDLVGIKGGANSGIKNTTTNVLLHVTIDNPVLIRRASQAMSLRSDASAIYERGPDKGGTINALTRATNLILEEAGGEIASEVIDLKKVEFTPWKLILSFKRLEKILGVSLPKREVVEILTRLRLSPRLNGDKIECTIPTYRGDLKLEEDLVEEVARIHGYNKFPKTLPTGTVNPKRVPYYFDNRAHLLLKNLLVSSGYTEIMTLSLISKDLIDKSLMNKDSHIKLANPVSIDYEYLRVSLIPSLLLAIKLNVQEKTLQLFELNKVYLGAKAPEKASEPYKIAGIAMGQEFRMFKGVIDLTFERLNIQNVQTEVTPEPNSLWHPIKSGIITIKKDNLGHFGEISPQVLDNLGIEKKVFAFEFQVDSLLKYAKETLFKSVPSFPPQIEDITLTFPKKTKIGDVVSSILQSSKLVANVELTDIYKDSYTFRIWYQNPAKTLTDKEVEEVRKKLVDIVKKKFGAYLKS